MLMEVYRSESGETKYYAGPVGTDPEGQKYVILTRTYDDKGGDVWKMLVVDDYGEFRDKLELSRHLQTFIDCL